MVPRIERAAKWRNKPPHEEAKWRWFFSLFVLDGTVGAGTWEILVQGGVA